MKKLQNRLSSLCDTISYNIITVCTDFFYLNIVGTLPFTAIVVLLFNTNGCSSVAIVRTQFLIISNGETWPFYNMNTPPYSRLVMNGK